MSNLLPTRDAATLAFWQAVQTSAEYIQASLTAKVPLESSKLEAAAHILEIAFKPKP